MTFPLIAPVALELGRRILGYGAPGRDYERVPAAFAEALAALRDGMLSLVGLGHSDWGKLVPFLRDILWPYLVGGLLPGLVAAVASYYLVRPLVAAYQARRRARMLERAHRRLAEQTEADAARPRPYNPEASISAEGEAGT